jgi:hypothetical protein
LALLHYTGRASTEEPIAPPRFFHDDADRTESDGAAGESSIFTLAVDAETKAALKREADKYQVPLQRILRHEVIVYLADMDSAAEENRQKGPGGTKGTLSFTSGPGR